MYRLNIGRRSDGEEMTVETTFPGAVDFDKGLIKTDFQLWPLFQAVDIDAILTVIEVGLLISSNHSSRAKGVDCDEPFRKGHLYESIHGDAMSRCSYLAIYGRAEGLEWYGRSCHSCRES